MTPGQVLAAVFPGGTITGCPKTGAEPYEYYLRGRQCLHRMRQPDLDRSKRMFEGAIELDASYAPAWAGLATVHAMRWIEHDPDYDLLRDDPIRSPAGEAQVSEGTSDLLPSFDTSNFDCPCVAGTCKLAKVREVDKPELP